MLDLISLSSRSLSSPTKIFKRLQQAHCACCNKWSNKWSTIVLSQHLPRALHQQRTYLKRWRLQHVLLYTFISQWSESWFPWLQCRWSFETSGLYMFHVWNNVLLQVWWRRRHYLEVQSVRVSSSGTPSIRFLILHPFVIMHWPVKPP